MIFPPAFLHDSSSWNDNQHHQQQVVAGGDASSHELLQPSIMGGVLPDGGGDGGGGQVIGGPAKPMSMAERARLARIPLPEPGLKCPRCDSTNTKFCYFNNYSLSQPRHFCRACRRYWTRGGALRNVPVGGGYRRHAKRAKPKQQQHAAAASAGTGAAMQQPPAGSTMASSAAACTVTTTMTTNALHAGPGGGMLPMLPPLLRLADFDAMSLGSSFSGISSMGKPGSISAACYPHSAGGLDQWRVQQMQSFPFLHAMDQGPLGPPLAMTMAAPGGMFQLGLDTTSDNSRGGGGGEDGSSAGEALHMMQAATKRESYPAPRAMYGDQHHHHLAAAGGYTSYSTNAAAGNHLL